MTEREVRDFVIVSPYAKRVEVIAAKERLQDYMSRRFPKFKFTVALCAPIDDRDEFAVIPVIGVIGNKGKCDLCEKPKPWLISELTIACAEFDLTGKHHFAA